MDVETHPAPGLVFRTTGGMVELYFFMGPTPGSVMRDFSDGMGRAELPPYWAYGYQLGSNYENFSELETEFNQTAVDAAIPVETVVLGHTIGANYQDFSVDPENFGTDLTDFVE